MVPVGAQLRGFAARCRLTDILIDGDLDRSLAARILAGFQRGIPRRLIMIFNGAVSTAAARILYHHLHHRAREYRLRLQRPDGEQQEQQCSQ